MDPITQAAAGAAAAVALSRPKETRLALLVGATAGAAPDLDVLIRSAGDPLLALEYHRHFSHSLFVAPFIGLVVAGLFLLLCRGRTSFRSLAMWSVAATLTHGPIDACTSYGTMLYWPLINHRESWDIISIIDPIFTLPLLLSLFLAFVWRKRGLALLGLFLCLGYLAFGVIQRERAEDFLHNLAEVRHHQPQQVSVRPSFANLIAWRLIYREGPYYHVAAVNLLPFRKPVFYPGGLVPVFTREDAEQLAPEGSRLREDIARFRFFSQNFLSLIPGEAEVLGDLRYATLPHSLHPLWGIRYDPDFPESHVQMAYFREASAAKVAELWTMIQGQRLPKEP